MDNLLNFDFNSAHSAKWIFQILMGVVVLWVTYFRSRRKFDHPDGPLNLKKTATDLTSQPQMSRLDYSTLEEMRQSRDLKNLNVIFMFNGHSFDAYEVLGLPAGSPLSACEAAYKEAIARTDPNSRAFLQMAWESIKNQRAVS